MKTILILLFSLVSFLALSQTKKIAHKSHSGSMSHYQKSKVHPSTQRSNFGLPGNQFFSLLDTVRMINPTEAELIYRKSYKCHSSFTKISDLKKEDFERHVLRVSDLKGLSKNSSREEILNQIFERKLGLWFDNPTQEAVFIGLKK